MGVEFRFPTHNSADFFYQKNKDNATKEGDKVVIHTENLKDVSYPPKDFVLEELGDRIENYMCNACYLGNAGDVLEILDSLYLQVESLYFGTNIICGIAWTKHKYRDISSEKRKDRKRKLLGGLEKLYSYIDEYPNFSEEEREEILNILGKAKSVIKDE